MLTIPVAVARSCLGVFRRLLTHRRPRDSPPLVGVTAGPGGTRLRFHTDPIAAEFQLPDAGPRADFCLPLDVLAVPAGAPVMFDPSAGSPPGDVPRFPAWPDAHVGNGPELTVALADAARTAAREPCRYALSGILLRGKGGEVVASDGRQLLIQRGFRFGWQEDLLVGAVKVFESKELRGKPVSVARDKDRVLLRTGGWTLSLRAEAEARYPDVQAVIPREEEVRTTCRLASADAQAILAALPRLPGHDEKSSPVTLELGRICRLVAGEGKEAEALSLIASKAEGRPARTVVDRTYLARAIRLGFDALHVGAPDRPVVCRDARRAYVFMPLDAGGPVPKGPPARPDTKEEPVPIPTNGRPAADHDPPDAADPLAEAEAVRALLAEAQSRLARLVAGLKQHRRQARVVQSALASLRNLPPLAR